MKDAHKISLHYRPRRTKKKKKKKKEEEIVKLSGLGALSSSIKLEEPPLEMGNSKPSNLEHQRADPIKRFL